MRPKLPRLPLAHAAIVATAVMAVLLAGAAPKKKKKEPPPPSIQETVGDLSFVVSRGEWKVEGVGLVLGLNNTGADAPQSWYRKQLVDEREHLGMAVVRVPAQRMDGVGADRVDRGPAQPTEGAQRRADFRHCSRRAPRPPARRRR